MLLHGFVERWRLCLLATELRVEPSYTVRSVGLASALDSPTEGLSEVSFRVGEEYTALRLSKSLTSVALAMLPSSQVGSLRTDQRRNGALSQPPGVIHRLTNRWTLFKILSYFT